MDRGLSNMQKNYATSVKRGRFTQQFVEERFKPYNRSSVLNVAKWTSVNIALLPYLHLAQNVLFVELASARKGGHVKLAVATR